MLTPRERLETVIAGEWADHVPFAVYSNKFFISETERMLRNKGMCIVEQFGVPLYSMETAGIDEKTIYYGGLSGTMLESSLKSDAIIKIERVISTPVGAISETFHKLPDYPRIPGELLPWHVEYLFKSPDDYGPIEYLISNRSYTPNYEAFRRGQNEIGGDIFPIPWIGYSPLQEIIINIMGVEGFAIEWHNRRDQLFKLYETLILDRRKRYKIAANSPAKALHYCGNVSPEVVGLERFQEYILPHYNEFAEILHANGKILAVHFDANTRLLAESIAYSKIDIIEAFTPYPSCDMTLAEARSVWRDKILWINFPPATILEPPEIIKETTRDLLHQVIPGDRFVIGITETVPPDKWQAGFSAISDVIDNEGQLPLMY